MTGPSANRLSICPLRFRIAFQPRSIETFGQATLNLSRQIDLAITLETSHSLFISVPLLPDTFFFKFNFGISIRTLDKFIQKFHFGIAVFILNSFPTRKFILKIYIFKINVKIWKCITLKAHVKNSLKLMLKNHSHYFLCI